MLGDVVGQAVDSVLRVSVRDGVGGAAPARGSGLVGLKDRVEARSSSGAPSALGHRSTSSFRSATSDSSIIPGSG
jgi:hypothetical protein